MRVERRTHTSKDFIAALAGENHLHTHGLDFPGEEVHGSGSADGGDIVGLEVVDNLREGVQTLLDGEHILVVHGAQVVSCFASGEKIRRVLETN